MSVRIIVGDVREKLAELPDSSIHCVVTSPPYWGLRDYGVAGQIGLEPDFRDYIATMVGVFREVRRVLRPDGTLWLNLGDSYANDGKYGGETGGKQFYLGEANRKRVGREKRLTGLKPKDLCGIPWRVAFALQEDGWWLRQDIIWSKPNPMPESVTDRCTKAHEYLFLLSKSERYYFNQAAIAEPLGATSVARLSRQNLEGQHGSDRVPGKTNGPMKAVGLRRPAGNRTHKGTTAYEAGEERFRTKAGLVGFAERERAKVENGDLVGTRNRRSVWEIATQPYKEAHFATFPPALVEPCILAGCPAAGAVLDPFFGAGTTGLVADRLGRNCIGIELSPEYATMARRRIQGDAPLIADVA